MLKLKPDFQTLPLRFSIPETTFLKFFDLLGDLFIAAAYYNAWPPIVDLEGRHYITP